MNPSSRCRPGLAWYVGGGLLLIGVQAALALTARPNYLSSFNPLLGGINTARQVMLVGWGEGLGEAARYLNAQDAGGRVAAWYGQNVFGAFYQGQSYDLYYDLRTPADLYAQDVDYVVTYVNQEQRRLLDQGVQARLGAPVFTTNAGPVALAQVYRWAKPFSHTADRSLAPGLRLLGWDLPAEAPAAGVLDLVLYWDAAELANRQTGSGPVLAWLKDAAGEVWATDQGTPQIGPRPATGWLEHPAAGQRFGLRLPTGLSAGTYHVEMASTGGQGLALGNVTIGATQLANAQPATDWQPAAGQVSFGKNVTLAGYALQRQGQELGLDLLWTAQEPPHDGDKFFVHVVGDDDQIVAQADGVLDLGATTPGWQPGDLVRRRVRLPLPGGSHQPALRIFLGLYRPADGPRLPLVVGDQPVADGRYPLTTLSTP